MKLVAAIILGILILILGVQIYNFLVREKQVGSDLSGFQTRLDQAKKDKEKLEAELKYYSEPANLNKELKERFNYREIGEKLLIIVSRDGSSTVPSSTNNR